MQMKKPTHLKFLITNNSTKSFIYKIFICTTNKKENASTTNKNVLQNNKAHIKDNGFVLQAKKELWKLLKEVCSLLIKEAAQLLYLTAELFN